MNRYYVLSVEPTLLGDAALVRRWHRLGTVGRQRLDLYAERREARTALNVWLAGKLRRGYAPRVRNRLGAPSLGAPNGGRRLVRATASSGTCR
jgi:predicted DNA-binding WGR domain protein